MKDGICGELMQTDVEIPGIRIGSLIGEGAFGRVFRGRHASLDIDVAVKIVEAGDGRRTGLEQALREARLCARLDHPNLLRVFDAGRVEAALYLILEYMDGGSLESTTLTRAEDALRISRQLLAGLEALHRAGIIHRDIKPANCLLRSADARVKIADLGIAVDVSADATLLSQFAGTLPFMAPELLEATPRYSERTDLYALGMTLASIVCEERPYPRLSLGKMEEWIRSGERPSVSRRRPDLPRTLTELIERMISPSPAERPESASECLSLSARSVSRESARSEPVTPARHRHRATGPSAAGADGDGLHEGEAIGPWLLLERTYASINWANYGVVHERTGVSALLTHMQPTSRFRDTHAANILKSAEFASRLDHRGFLPVLDWGEVIERPYVVVANRGRSLLSLVEAQGPLGELESVEIVAGLADALARLHERGYVYQLVTPETAQLAADGRTPQFTWPLYCVPEGDYTQEQAATMRAFSIHFAAPEALRSETRFSRSTDIYGIGQLLHFLIFGARPITDAKATIAADEPMQRYETLFTPLRDLKSTVTQPTSRLVSELLHPKPERRPAAAAAVRDELLHIAAGLRPRT